MSANQLTGVAGGLSGQGLGGLTGTLQGGVGKIVNLGSSWLDRFFPPERREELKAKLAKFATEKPYLASFLLSQLALSGPALALFIIMTISVALFALIAGILIGVLGALVFIVGAIAFALIILLPILFFTTFAAVAIWLWGMGAYKIIQWFNKKEVPGIHKPLDSGGPVGGLLKQTGLGDSLPALNGGAGKPQPPKQQNHDNEKEKTSAKTTGANHNSDGKENHATPKKQTTTQRRPASSEGKKADGQVPDVGKTVGGVTKNIGI